MVKSLFKSTKTCVLFAIFINDIAGEINKLGLGVPLSDGDRLSMLMYADDLVLIASSPKDLQCMLNTLYNRTIKWRLSINIEKTKVMHCRKQRNKNTDFTFQLGDYDVKTVGSYRYLGLDIK